MDSSPPSPPVSGRPLSPARLAGRYTLRRKLGSGSVGTVYLAHDLARGEEVALKLIRTERLSAPAVHGMQQEFRAIASLEHPQIASAYDFGYTDEGLPYYTREYVPGVPLPPGPPENDEPRRFLGPILDVLDALQYLHAGGVLHVDIHAGNLILSSDAGRGGVLIDFGFVRPGDDLQHALTASGWAEVPPELLKGEVGPGTDVYFVGSLLHYRLTGRAGGEVRLLREIPGWGARLTLDLERITTKALQPAPGQRFQSAPEFREALSEVLGERERQPARLSPRGKVVGRDRELRRVEERLRAAAAGKPALLAVCGRAGQGKTRLLEEARLRAQLAQMAGAVREEWERRHAIPDRLELLEETYPASMVEAREMRPFRPLERRIVDALRSIGRPIRLVELAKALEVPLQKVRAALRPLRRAEVVLVFKQGRSSSYRLHASYSGPEDDRISPHEVRLIHERVAAHLEACPSSKPADREHLARHLLAAGRTGRGCQVAVEAADLLRGQGSFDRAYRLLREAFERVSSLEMRLELAELMSAIAEETGDHDAGILAAARDHLEDARRHLHRSLHTRDLLLQHVPAKTRARYLGHPRFDALTSTEARLRRSPQLFYSTARLRRAQSYEGMVGQSTPMRRVFQMIEKVADQEVIVLLQGETGTGKELVARAIHRRSGRRERPFIAVHCASLPGQLFESELFGTVAGAYTGADEDRAGLLETASGGTMLLDEIGQLPPEAQGKLLQVLDSKRFRRLGSVEAQHVDVRLLASSSDDLAARVREGRLRVDLYYRLSGVSIELPPLRERTSDVPGLARHLLEKQAQRLGRPAPAISGDALRLLRDADWPGNVRQLEGVLLRVMLSLSGTEPIRAEDIEAAAGPREARASGGHDALFDEEIVDRYALPELRIALERQYLTQLFMRCRGDGELMMRELGVKRTRLYTWFRKLGLDVRELRKRL